jgi:hypothetical protein
MSVDNLSKKGPSDLAFWWTELLSFWSSNVFARNYPTWLARIVAPVSPPVNHFDASIGETLFVSRGSIVVKASTGRFVPTIQFKGRADIFRVVYSSFLPLSTSTTGSKRGLLATPDSQTSKKRKIDSFP